MMNVAAHSFYLAECLEKGIGKITQKGDDCWQSKKLPEHVSLVKLKKQNRR